jgi:hypothetical protein
MFSIAAIQVMRHKYNQGLDFYLDFIAQAAGALGPGRVRSILMIGLEPMAQVSGISPGNFFSATGIPMEITLVGVARSVTMCIRHGRGRRPHRTISRRPTRG